MRVVAITASAVLLVRAADNQIHESADGEDKNNCDCEHGYHLPTNSKLNTIHEKVQSAYESPLGPCGFGRIPLETDRDLANNAVAAIANNFLQNIPTLCRKLGAIAVSNGTH